MKSLPFREKKAGWEGLGEWGEICEVDYNLLI